MPSYGYQVNPLDSALFQTQAIGDQPVNYNGWNDLGQLSNLLARLPNAEQFMRAESAPGDNQMPAGVNPTLLADYLARTGYKIFENPNASGGRLSVVDGQDKETAGYDYSNKDSAFKLASSLVGAAGGGLLGSMAGLGSVATGALSGGMAGGANDPNDPSLKSIAKGALVGGAIGGVADYMGAGAPAAPEPSGLPWEYGADFGDANLLTGGGNALTGGYAAPQPSFSSLLGASAQGAQAAAPQAAQAPAAVAPAAQPQGAGFGSGLMTAIGNNPLQAATIGAGLLAGSQSQGGGTKTQTSQIDPRMAEALYGSSGFLPAAQDWYAKNKSGTNDTIKQGQQMQLGLLQDPRIAQQIEQMRSQSFGLLGKPVAGNPFMRG